MAGRAAPLFQEEQRFSQGHLRLVLAIPPAVFLMAAVWQAGFGHILKHPQISNGGLIGWTIFLWLIYLRLITVRLVTEVRTYEVAIAMRGLWKARRIPLATIKAATAMKCDPIKDFGGYGIRPIRNGRAYIAANTQAVRIELNDGSVVVIGSQRAKDLAGAVARNKENGGVRHETGNA